MIKLVKGLFQAVMQRIFSNNYFDINLSDFVAHIHKYPIFV
jgi:hypothetical protein